MCDQRPLPDLRVKTEGGLSAPTVLMIGRADARAESHLRHRSTSVVACGFAVLDAPLLDRVAPAIVAFPLMTSGFDAIQVLSRLAALGFTGRAIVFAPQLPNRDMVLRELRIIAPALSLEVIELLGD